MCVKGDTRHSACSGAQDTGAWGHSRPRPLAPHSPRLHPLVRSAAASQLFRTEGAGLQRFPPQWQLPPRTPDPKTELPHSLGQPHSPLCPSAGKSQR